MRVCGTLVENGLSAVGNSLSFAVTGVTLRDTLEVSAW
jgi:hypothetical protein